MSFVLSLLFSGYFLGVKFKFKNISEPCNGFLIQTGVFSSVYSSVFAFLCAPEYVCTLLRSVSFLEILLPWVLQPILFPEKLCIKSFLLLLQVDVWTRRICTGTEDLASACSSESRSCSCSPCLCKSPHLFDPSARCRFVSCQTGPGLMRVYFYSASACGTSYCHL